jgi:hypothetical protein
LTTQSVFISSDERSSLASKENARLPGNFPIRADPRHWTLAAIERQSQPAENLIKHQINAATGDITTHERNGGYRQYGGDALLRRVRNEWIIEQARAVPR